MSRGGPALRSHTCGELRAEHVGSTVVLNGWVAARRDHGGIYFVDLRDRYGLTQVVLDAEQAESIRFSAEWVLSVEGEVVHRAPGQVNPDRPTGEIEVRARRVEVLSESLVPPFEVIDEVEAAVEIRLRHRYVDLRRPGMQKNLLRRAALIAAIRRGFEARGFVEIETPILTRATPEGARDYLVPSRVHPGEFYALPQSPQLFKQILMVAGLDRYFQVARCFRDEDLRADRQPEFSQLDMEMSFVDEERVFEVWEGVLGETFRSVLGVELPARFERLTWDEAVGRYGVDKPDTRFALELCDLGAWAATSEFAVFRGALEQGGSVLGLTVPGGAERLSRKDIDQLEALAKTYGAKGLAWWKPTPEGGAGPVARFAGPEGGRALAEAAQAAHGDLVLFAAGPTGMARRVLGELRVHLGRKLELIQPGWNFLWVTDFPMFEWDEDAGRWFSAHHPFTSPTTDLSELPPGTDARSSHLAGLRSRAYDLVLNGWELGSGSIRIHRRDLQARVFDLLGIDAEEQARKFGFLLEALAHGAPPHGGFALGLDRLAAMTLGLDSIRDVIAFPKTASATDLMCQAPSAVAAQQLAEVHVGLAGRALARPLTRPESSSQASASDPASTRGDGPVDPGGKLSGT